MFKIEILELSLILEQVNLSNGKIESVVNLDIRNGVIPQLQYDNSFS